MIARRQAYSVFFFFITSVKHNSCSGRIFNKKNTAEFNKNKIKIFYLLIFFRKFFYHISLTGGNRKTTNGTQKKEQFFPPNKNSKLNRVKYNSRFKETFTFISSKIVSLLSQFVSLLLTFLLEVFLDNRISLPASSLRFSETPRLFLSSYLFFSQFRNKKC